MTSPGFGPDWGTLAGGASDGAWDADRARKATKIVTTSASLAKLAKDLARAGALREATPEILRRHPQAAEWYVALACYADKTLRSTRGIQDAHDMSAHPATLKVRIMEGAGRVSEADLRAFCNWVNAEIQRSLPKPYEDEESHAIHVAMIAGARIVGQGQNEGGSEAVNLFKRALSEVGGGRDWSWEKGGAWSPVAADLDAALTSHRWRHDASGTLFEFPGGGNHPDVKVTRRGATLLVGEIKGRKDKSNTWESWMPQVVDHLKTWRTQHPGAMKGVFGTVFDENMIEGVSEAGTPRTGLRELHRDGLLAVAINLTFVSEQGVQRDQFRALVRHLTSSDA